MSRRPVAALVPALVLVTALLAGCGPRTGGGSQRELIDVVSCWFAGIDQRNFELLARCDANAPAPGSPEFAAFEAKVNEILDQYEIQKQQGHWQPDPDGYAIPKALLLGRTPGSLWGVPERKGTSAAPVLTVKATFGYDEISEQGLPPGTVLFLQGFPVGTIHRVEIGGNDKERTVDILDELQLAVHLERVQPTAGNDPVFKVRRAELIESSAKHRNVRWIF